MKKLIAFALALACVLGLIGCGTLTSAQDTSANSVSKEDALMKVTQFMTTELQHTGTACVLGNQLSAYRLSEGKLEALDYEMYPLFLGTEVVAFVTCFLNDSGEYIAECSTSYAKSFRKEYSVQPDNPIAIVYAQEGAYLVREGDAPILLREMLMQDCAPIKELDNCRSSLMYSVVANTTTPEPDLWAKPVHFYLHGKGYFHRGEITYELPEGYEFAGNVLDVGEVYADSRKDFEGNADGKIYMNPSVSDIAYFSWAEWNEKADGPAPFLKLKRESAEPMIFVQDFSYAKDSEVYTEGKPGVKTSGFLNTSEMEINADNVVERAKNECTIHWREVSVRRDTAAGIWLVVFGNHYPGGGQSVYLDDHGKTVLIVYGE